MGMKSCFDIILVEQKAYHTLRKSSSWNSNRSEPGFPCQVYELNYEYVERRSHYDNDEQTDQSPYSASPWNFETIHDDAIQQLRSRQRENRMSDVDFNVLLNTPKAKDVLAYANSTLVRDGQASKIERLKRVLGPLTQKLERFGTVIDTLISMAPKPYGFDVIGIIWGSLKFVLMVANDIAQAWDTVLNTLERIAAVLPSVQVYVEIFNKSRLQLLREPLTNLYASMVSFALQAVKLINKSKIRLMWSSLGRSLQNDLQQMISVMEANQTEVDRIAAVEHMNEQHDIKIGQDKFREDFDAFVSQQMAYNRKAQTNRIRISINSQDIEDKLLSTTSNIEPSRPAGPTGPFIDIPDLLTFSFSGRRPQLDELVGVLVNSMEPASACCVIHGMPGVGKSQIALRFAQDAFDAGHFAHVLWISASTVEKLTQGLSALVDLLELPHPGMNDQTARLSATRRWLETAKDRGSGKWLLVFDNVDDSTIELIRALIPRSHASGSILFTTRSESTASLLAVHGAHQHKIIELLPPEDEEAVDLFYAAAGSRIRPEERPEATKLVKTIGRLPLAIDQAASFLKVSQGHYNISDLIKLYGGEHGIDLLSWENERYAEKSVSATFSSAIRQLDRISPEGSSLLCMLAFLDAEAIPVKILVNGASNWQVARPRPTTMVRRTTSGFIQKVRESLLGPSPPAPMPDKPPSHRSISMQLAEDPEMPSLLAIMQNPVRFQNCISSVQNLCLIRRQTTRTESSLRMHDLIQYLTQHRLVQESREKIWLGAAIHIVYSAFRQLEDPSRPEQWTDCELFVPQIEALAKNAESLGVESEELVAARLVIAEYFESRGQYSQALSLFEVVNAHFRRTRGNGDRLTLRAANGLASAYTHMGNLTEARKLFDLVFEAYARRYGAEHEFSLRALENVAQITELQGNDVEAERLCLQVLEGHERRPGGGPEHPDTLKALRSLALSQLSQGKLEDAEINFRRILQVYEAQNKLDDRETLSVVHGLACTHMAHRQFDVAEPLFDRAWRGRKALLTETHHDTLAVAMNYSLVLDSTGRSIEAEKVCRHAASELQRQFGSRHEDVLQANAHLAQILVHLGRTDEGEQLLTEILGTRNRTLGEGHLETRRTAQRLKTLQDNGRLDMIENLKATAV